MNVERFQTDEVRNILNFILFMPAVFSFDLKMLTGH